MTISHLLFVSKFCNLIHNSHDNCSYKLFLLKELVWSMLSTVLLYFTFVKGGLRSLFLDKGWFYYKKTHTGANGP